jgi:ATP-dependent DNA helicase 2 subunit 1
MADEFDGNKFYKEFLCTAMNIENPETYEIMPPGESQEALMQRILKRDFRKKVLYHLTLNVTDELAISVNMYSFLQKSKYPKKQRLLRDTNEVVQTKKAYMVADLAPGTENYDYNKPLLPGDMRKVQTSGGEKISFKADEVIKMKTMLEPGIKILGFKPLTKYSSLMHLRPCLFLYPNEQATKGSTTVFRALWEKCLEKEKVAFCIITMRRKSTSK